MIPKKTIAYTIVNNMLSSQSYIRSFSRRSLTLVTLFTGLLIFCFCISSRQSFSSSSSTWSEEYLAYVRNDTQLLSNNQFTNCQNQCPVPLTKGLSERQVFEACLDRGKLAEYYLTIVVVTRNDNYADFQYERVQNMIDSTFLLAEGTKTRLELLMVEWNPDPTKRRIRDTYRFRRSEHLTYRILTIPPSVHEKFRYENSKSLYEYEGKNLGIRHARGEFIVCTNQDDIWSTNMYEIILSKSWKRNMIYTQFQDKYSYTDDEEQVDLGKSTTMVQLGHFPTDKEIQSSCNMTSPTTTNNDDTQQQQPFTLPKPETKLDRENYLRIGHEASDFTLAHRDVWMKVGGYRETGATIWMDIEFLLTAFHTKGIPITYSPWPFNCHQLHRHVYHAGADRDNQGVLVDEIISKDISYANTGPWGLSNLDLYQHGAHCDVFRGGMAI